MEKHFPHARKHRGMPKELKRIESEEKNEDQIER